MGEVLFWMAAVFAVLGVPPLVAAWRASRREHEDADQRRRQRQSEESNREEEAPRKGAVGSSTGWWMETFPKRDEPEQAVAVVADDVLEVDGGVAVRELNTRYGLSLPESADYATVAGLVLQRLGNVPAGGESVEIGDYRIRVTAMAGRRIARIRIETVRTAQEA